MNCYYKSYNTVVSDNFTESDEAVDMLFLDSAVDEYKQLIEFQRKLVLKGARPKYTKDLNMNKYLNR